MARRVIQALLLAACAACITMGAAPQARPKLALRAVTVGMGYIPSVQFAPFYVAQQSGYYRQAGLRVTFSYASSPNLLELVGAGNVDFANADGTDVIAAAAQHVPITYVAATYQRFPVAIFALASRHIRSVRDLRGRTVGVPGRYGATYVGLLAVLYTAGLRPADVKIQTVGYTQAESVAAGKVDAAVGYSTNEPVLLARRGLKITTLEVGNVANLVAPGVVTGRGLVARDPMLVRAFVQATLHGLADTIHNPRMAFDAARRVHGLTTLRGRDVADQYAVLLRSIDFWRGPGTRAHGLGYADPTQWRDSTRILRAIGVLTGSTTPSAFTNRFVLGAARV